MGDALPAILLSTSINKHEARSEKSDDESKSRGRGIKLATSDP
jgi:hypothetical protein